MKKLLIALGVSAAVVSSPVMAAEVSWDSGSSGVVKPIIAQIEPSSCQYDFAVSTLFTADEVLNLTPNAPQKQASLNKNKVGDNKTPFSFTFKDCPPVNTKGKQKLAMYVDNSNTMWTPTNFGDGVLGNIAPNGIEKAQNAFVRLYVQGETNPMKFGKANPVEKDLKTEMSDITFNFEAELFSPNKSATSGTVQANAPFIVEYK